MYARFIRTDGDFDRGVVVDFLAEVSVPAYQHVPGYRGVTASCQPDTGTVWTLSSWDTGDAVRASAELSEHLRALWVETTHTLLRGVRVYHMPLEVFAPQGPTTGNTLQILPFRLGTVAGAESGLASVREDLVPALVTQQGFRAARLLVDRATGSGLVASDWVDADAGWAAYAATAGVRALAERQGAEVRTPTQREIIFTHVLAHSS